MDVVETAPPVKEALYPDAFPALFAYTVVIS